MSVSLDSISKITATIASFIAIYLFITADERADTYQIELFASKSVNDRGSDSDVGSSVVQVRELKMKYERKYATFDTNSLFVNPLHPYGVYKGFAIIHNASASDIFGCYLNVHGYTETDAPYQIDYVDSLEKGAKSSKTPKNKKFSLVKYDNEIEFSGNRLLPDSVGIQVKCRQENGATHISKDFRLLAGSGNYIREIKSVSFIHALPYLIVIFFLWLFIYGVIRLTRSIKCFFSSDKNE